MRDLHPGGFFAWILVGLLAGWIAGQLTRGHDFGCLGNLGIGLLGAVVGGLVFSAIGAHGAVNFVGSVAVATLGAVMLLAVANLARR